MAEPNPLTDTEIARAEKLRELELESMRVSIGLKDLFHAMHEMLRKFSSPNQSHTLDAHRKIGVAERSADEACDWIRLAFLKDK